MNRGHFMDESTLTQLNGVLLLLLVALLAGAVAYFGLYPVATCVMVWMLFRIGLLLIDIRNAVQAACERTDDVSIRGPDTSADRVYADPYLGNEAARPDPLVAYCKEGESLAECRIRHGFRS